MTCNSSRKAAHVTLYGIQALVDDQWLFCEADGSDYYEKAFRSAEAARAYADEGNAQWEVDAGRFGWTRRNEGEIYRVEPLPTHMIAHDIMA